MSWMNTPVYPIHRSTGRCACTGDTLEPGQLYMAVLVEADAEPAGETVQDSGNTKKPQAASPREAWLKRVDLSMAAWEQGHRPEHLFSYWQARVPQPEEKKKLFVDDEVLMNLFIRLADSDQPDRLAFRFVLALILMRKKILRYDGCEKRADGSGDPREWWKMTPKGSYAILDDHPIDVLNPEMNDEQIQQVTEQLGQILEAEL